MTKLLVYSGRDEEELPRKLEQPMALPGYAKYY